MKKCSDNKIIALRESIERVEELLRFTEDELRDLKEELGKLLARVEKLEGER